MAKSQTVASNKYNAKAYDRIALQVKKGQREVIRQHAESKGLSLNGYINKLISDDMNVHQSDSSEQRPEEVSVTEIPIVELDISVRTYDELRRKAETTVIREPQKMIDEYECDSIRNKITPKCYENLIEALKKFNADN